jgi:bile acid:Na+ symporter, BASS family
MLRDAALVAIVFLMFLAGLRAAPGAILATLRETSLIVRALVANVILVPILAIVLVRGFSLSAPIAIGIMLMALAPGIPFLAASAGAKKGGSDALAVSLSFLLPAASVITLPLWVTILAPAMGGLNIPVGRSVATILLAQVLPLFAGLLVGRRSERARAALLRPVSIVSVLALLFLVVLIVVPGAKALAAVFGSGAIVAILTLVVLSLAIGWYLGGPQPETRHTLALATSLRNVGLAATLATTFFAGTDVMVTVVAFLIIQLLVAALAGAYFSRTAIRVPPAATAIGG